MIRVASAGDAPRIAFLVNQAFKVEAFFKIGDRTSTEEIVEMMAHGEFLLLEEGGVLAGCVYLTVRADRAYFGMLSIEPSRQGQGLGRRLVGEVEGRCRERGCEYIDIHLVNLRAELLGFYDRLGYVETGTLPFSDAERSSRSCHFIVMTKALS
jgi:GNAT superfamily N-acetyltransferase